MKTSYKLLSYSANKVPRAGVLVGETVYDAQKATGVAAHASMLGLLADWAAAKKPWPLLKPRCMRAKHAFKARR